MIRFDRSIAKRILLLDLQHDSIDWILLRSGLRNVMIEKSGRLASQAGFVNGSEMTAALKELRDSLGKDSMECLASIACRGLVVRHLAVPFDDKRKVRQILPLELESTLPMPVEGLSLDFRMTGRSHDKMVVAVAMPEETITTYREILQQAGLDPLLLTVSGVPAATLLAESPQGENISLLIDGDSHHCMLFIIGNHQILFIRNWPPPAGDIVSAEMLKETIDQTIEAAAQVLPVEAKLSSIYLTPRSTRYQALENLSTEECPVAVFDVKAFSPTEVTGARPNDQGQGALALGLYEPLSEKGLNLYRSTFPIKRFLLQHRSHFIRTGILVIVLTALFMMNVYLDITRAEKRAAHLEKESETILKSAFPETRNVVNPLQQMIVNLRQMRTHEFGSMSGLRIAQIDILAAISKALPESIDIHVSQYVSGAQRVQLNGTTDTFEAVNQAKELLEKTDFFDKITIVSANMDPSAGRVRFKLAIDLKR